MASVIQLAQASYSRSLSFLLSFYIFNSIRLFILKSKDEGVNLSINSFDSSNFEFFYTFKPLQFEPLFSFMSSTTHLLGVLPMTCY